MIEEITSLGNKIDQNKINKDVSDFFNNYLNNPLLKDDSYDCSEIADDFYNHFQFGNIIKIYSDEVIFFDVPEYGVLKKYQNHYVYVNDGIVFDPRFTEKPVYLDDYIDYLKKVNNKNILYIYE